MLSVMISCVIDVFTPVLWEIDISAFRAIQLNVCSVFAAVSFSREK